ncbi:hypothetical protein TCE0_033f08101 [Talaromyces pinophilus]|jgi:hypothetical protein|uniref:FAR-17a/AIG1-like protein n=1 Tax=Talaromyces pinophilus TaxID=128442 RepID=A0A6V8H8X1_TALPI|nr:hypothetical protein TCE0_033f08101 [Talaromyces pinophilus]
MARRPFLTLFGADPALDSLHPYETSWLLPPILLGLIRSIIAIYIFFCIVYIFIYDATHNDSVAIGQSFSFFTFLNFWGMGFYFAVSAVHTLLYAATGRSVILDKLPRVFRGLHALFYTCVTTFPFLVVVIYWAVLYSGPWFREWFGAWSNVCFFSFPQFIYDGVNIEKISEHGIIGLYALLEVFLTTTPPHPLINLAFLILILLLYLSLAYLTHYTQGWYTYSFLDPGDHGQHNGKVAAYCFIILAIILVVFFATWGLIWLRRKLTHGKIKRSRRDLAPVYGDNSHLRGLRDEEMRMGRIKRPNEF